MYNYWKVASPGPGQLLIHPPWMSESTSPSPEIFPNPQRVLFYKLVFFAYLTWVLCRESKTRDGCCSFVQLLRLFLPPGDRFDITDLIVSYSHCMFLPLQPAVSLQCCKCINAQHAPGQQSAQTCVQAFCFSGAGTIWISRIKLRRAPF